MTHGELVESAVQAALDAGVAENGNHGVASARVAARHVIAHLMHEKPVAWRVKDFADGWIYYTDEDLARRHAYVMADALVQPLYVKEND